MQIDNAETTGPIQTDEIKPCMSCMAPNPITAAVCSECGNLIDGGSVLSPMGVAKADAKFLGEVLKGDGADRRPTKLKVIVVWIILVPLMMISVVLAAQHLMIRDGLLSFVIFWAGVVIAWFSLVGLYHVTNDFLRPRDPELK